MKIQIPNFSQAHVLVIGDVILDRYWQGNTKRISPEAPVPIVHVNNSSESAGGAANVALNIAALGATVSLLGIVGNDEAGISLQSLLKAQKVHTYLKVLDNVRTITKLRVLSRDQQLLRLDFEEQLPNSSAEILSPWYKKKLINHKVIVLSDYGKGTLANAQTLIKLARDAKLAVFIDPKGNDFTKYRGATLLTPNLKEFEAIVGHSQSELEIEQKARILIQQLELTALLITRSKKGMTLIERDQAIIHIPTQARDVYDVTGAGDTVMGTLAAAFAVGQSLQQAALLANLAAGLVVAKAGTAVTSVAELKQALYWQYQAEQTVIVNEEQLLCVREQAKSRQEIVVMTNGCFDLLHAGHIAYLEQAKKLGDCLMLAVNDDASVQQLKGISRPITPLSERMAVLAGLKFVDYIIPFSESTPRRLIEKIMPDILVKGGDYTIEEQVAGAEAVLKNGGQVKLLPFKNGCSTSKIIEKIKRS